MVSLWTGYKIYLIVNAKMNQSKKSFNQDSDTDLVPARSCKNKMTQTLNEDLDQQKVIYRNHRKDHSILRCSESGLL